MDYSEITVNHLFDGNTFPLHTGTRIEIQKKIQQLKGEILKKEPGLDWKNVYDEVMKMNSGLLNIKLKDILESAWKKFKEVMETIEKSKNHPEEVSIVPLLEHTVTSVHHPKIEIFIENVNLGSIDFELLLKLKLKGIILRIKNGDIEDVTTGSCLASGSFSCEGIKFFEESTKEFNF